MLFTSLKFFFFVPAVILVYFLAPRKLRALTLLLASCLFYAGFGTKYLIPMVLFIVFGYASGLSLEKAVNKKRTLCLLLAGFIAYFILCKYLGFILNNYNNVRSLMQKENIELPFSILQPVGISYIILQEISYLVDIYKGDLVPERRFADYALYILYFPRVMSGPIERYKEFKQRLCRIEDTRLWEGERLRDGFTRIAWGYFLKLCIADRLGIFVDTVYGSYSDQGRIVLILGCFAYSLQLYGDFVGSMDMVLGLGKVLGLDLTENFVGPLFSKSIKEAWNRWHVTLGSWLKDYIYIPLGGSRKGKSRQAVNLMIVFLISGLWHGAAWNFVAWGLINGLYVALDSFVGNKSKNTAALTGPVAILRILRTWVLWTFSFIAFRSDSLKDFIKYVARIITIDDFHVIRDGSLFEYGLSRQYMVFLALALVIMAVVEYLRYTKNTGDLAPDFGKLPLAVRYILLITLLMVIIIFGAYGPQYNAANFIYFGF